MDFVYESRVPSACGLTEEDEVEPGTVSCMLVGDGAVGKTSMIVSYTSNGYPTEYQQTAFDVFSGEAKLLFIKWLPSKHAIEKCCKNIINKRIK